jgi:hypothetical protein
VGYGNDDRVDIKAACLFVSDKNTVRLSASADGINGTPTLPAEYETEWNNRYYQANAGLDYEHRFAQPRLQLGAHGQVSDFNLLPSPVDRKQQFTLGDVHAAWQSLDDTRPLQFQLETNLLYYDRKNDSQRAEGAAVNNKETTAQAKAGIRARLSPNQFTGIALKANHISYNNPSFSNYTTLDLNPHYELNGKSWKLRAGINADVSLGYGKQLQLSPDLLLQHTFGSSYVLYAQASGGRQINDFRQLEATSPYAELTSQEQVANTYERVNAALGFKASPFSGFWFNVCGGYQRLQDDLYQWRSSAWLQYSNEAIALQTVGFEQAQTANLYAGIHLTYAYKDIINLSAAARGYEWYVTESHLVGSNDEPALYFKPAYSIDLSATIRPNDRLALHVYYQYLARQAAETQAALEPINNLNLSATGRLYKGLSLYLRGGNLLNRHYQYYYMCPVADIHLLAGLSLQF